MNIIKNLDGSTLTITLEGRLDTVTAPQLNEELLASYAGITELVFDLHAMDYISSAGLRVLPSAQKTMLKQGSMKVTGVTQTVREVLDITGFSDILTIE